MLGLASTLDVQLEVHVTTETKINKSEAIRKALAKYPDKKPKWIAEMLLGKKIEVTAQMVSQIKSKSKTKDDKVGAKKPVKDGRTFRDWPGAYGDLQDTIEYVKSVGGLERAEQLIALLKAAKEV